MRRLVVSQYDDNVRNAGRILYRDHQRSLWQQHEQREVDRYSPVMAGKGDAERLIVVGIRIDDRVVHEMRSAKRCVDGLKRQRRLLKIETVGEIVGVGIRISQ